MFERNNLKLRVGRIYIISPKQTPGFSKKKERPAILLKIKNNKFLFIQIGSTKIKYTPTIDWTKRLNYVWDKTSRISYLNIDISKYENFSTIKSPFSDNNKKYIDLKSNDYKDLYSYYMMRIVELEVFRLKQAKKYAFSGDIDNAARQLSLLKDIFPIKHKKIQPYKLAKRWLKNFNELSAN